MDVVVSSHFIEKNLSIIVGAILTERLSTYEDFYLRKLPLHRCSGVSRKGRLNRVARGFPTADKLYNQLQFLINSAPTRTRT